MESIKSDIVYYYEVDPSAATAEGWGVAILLFLVIICWVWAGQLWPRHPLGAIFLVVASSAIALIFGIPLITSMLSGY